MAVLPGIEASIEELIAKRNSIYAQLGISTNGATSRLALEEPKPKKSPVVVVERQKSGKTYACPTCGKVFDSGQGFAAHVRLAHPKPTVAVIPPHTKAPKQRKQKAINCPVCGLKMRSAGGLASHLKVHAPHRQRAEVRHHEVSA